MKKVDKISADTIAKKLKDWGKDNFDNIDDFAKAIGTTKGTLYSSYFNGKNMPGSPMLIKLAEQGCDINWLLNIEESHVDMVKEPSIKYNKKTISEIEQIKAENRRLIIENKKLKAELNKLKSSISKLL